MRIRLSESLRKCQLLLMLILGLCPVLLVIYIFVAPAYLPYAWMPPLTYMILAMLGFLIKGKYRLFYGIVGVLLLLAMSARLLWQFKWYAAVPTALMYLILFICSLDIARWSPEQELPGVFSILSLAIHLVFQLVAQLSAGHEGMRQIRPWAFGCFVGFILLAMLSLNRTCMYYASGGKPMSGGMKRKNTQLTLITAVVAAGLSTLTFIWDALRKLLSAIFGWIKSLGAASDDAVAATQPTPGPLPEMPAGSGTSNPFLAVLARILLTVAAAIVLFYLARYLVKKLIRLLASLRRYASRITEDYIEEITSTADDSDAQKIRLRRKIQKDGPKVQEMPPALQIRYYYRRLLRKHAKWSDASTARENLPRDAAAIYEKARYSNEPLSQSEVADFKEGIKKVK